MEKNKIRKSKFFKSNFIGKQLSRLRMSQSYYSIILSTVSAISLITLAYDLSFIFIVILFPVLLIITFIIGYYLDVKDINTYEHLESLERIQKFITIVDKKNQEFQLLQTELLIEAIDNINKGKDFNINELIGKKYKVYFNKWKDKKVNEK